MNEISKLLPAEAHDASENVHTALAAAQAEMQALIKGADNPHFKSKYADLADVVAAVRPALTRHGICYFHVPMDAPNGGYAVKTVLAHGASGTMIEAVVPLVGSLANMQGYKSATTYAKRIGLESVTGVAPDDDDGNEAAEQARNAPRQQARPQQRQPEPQRDSPIEDPDDAIVFGFVARINEAKTLDELGAVWSAHSRNFEARDPRAIAAKDARKAALGTPAGAQPERWPGDAAHRPLIDDSIPY